MTARGTLGAGVCSLVRSPFTGSNHLRSPLPLVPRVYAVVLFTFATLAHGIHSNFPITDWGTALVPHTHRKLVLTLAVSVVLVPSRAPAPMTNSSPIFRVSPSMSTTLRINSILHTLPIRPTQDLNLIRLTWSMATATVKLRYLIPSTVLNITRLTPGRSRVHTQYNLAMNPRLLPHTTASRTLVSP